MGVKIEIGYASGERYAIWRVHNVRSHGGGNTQGNRIANINCRSNGVMKGCETLLHGVRGVERNCGSRR